MKINIYYWNNGVGLVNDSILIKYILKRYDVVTYDIIGELPYIRSCDIGIHIQNFKLECLCKNKINIFMMNEEWLTDYEIFYINELDYIFTKSSYAKLLLDPYHKNVIYTGFFSMDKYFFPKHTEKTLHFKGKSIQKNTELVSKYESIKILNSEIEYLTDNQVIENLNNHDIHICCSLYESWGHYLWEAMSCGKLVICSEIPVFKEHLNPELVKFISTKEIHLNNVNYVFLKNMEYKLRKGYVVDENEFYDLLNKKDELLEFQKKNCDNIRQHFLDVNKKNKQKFLEVIESI